jgi:phosphoglycolate phosphatase
MTDFPFAIVGFDLDGTLVDSNRDLGPAINHALTIGGRPGVPPEAVRQLIGGGSRLMFERALQITGGQLPEPEFEALYGEMLTYYEAHIADRTVPYEGCLEALDELASFGCTLAVVTNKLEVFARKLLTELGMIERFACILGGDTLGPGRAKPAPDMIDTAILMCAKDSEVGRFAMVGDSSFDVNAARAADVPVVALSFGYNDVPVEDLGADAVVDHYRELVPALRRL